MCLVFGNGGCFQASYVPGVYSSALTGTAAQQYKVETISSRRWETCVYGARSPIARYCYIWYGMISYGIIYTAVGGTYLLRPVPVGTSRTEICVSTVECRLHILKSKATYGVLWRSTSSEASSIVVDVRTLHTHPLIACSALVHNCTPSGVQLCDCCCCCCR